jgi:hypothetical protein
MSLGLVEYPVDLQEELIRDQGAYMLHEIAISCTCRVEDTFAGLEGDAKKRRRDPYCPRCRGEGYLYRDPIVLQGLATSIRQQRNILDAGIAQPGDMLFSPQLSPPPTMQTDSSRKIGSWDKLTATWDQPLDDGHVLVRGAATLNENKGLKTGLSPDEDRLWYEPSTAIWCEDDNGVVYNDGEDFQLGPGKILKWVGKRPIVGQRFVIKYNCYFEWIVFAPPQERRGRDNDDLGQLVMLRKRHIAFVNDNPLALPEDRIPISARIRC